MITVSSMDMLNYFLRDHWDSFVLALPLHPGLFKSINHANNECHLKVLSSSTEHLKQLNNMLDKPLQVLLDIDPNYGRTGIPIDQLSNIMKFYKDLSALAKIKLSAVIFMLEIHIKNQTKIPLFLFLKSYINRLVP